MTPTPNPTAEQVIYRTLLETLGEAHDRVSHKIDQALRAHGLLSEGAPSEEQVERAAKAYLNGGIYTLESDGEHHARMRAALTAAGVTPQEPECDAVSRDRYNTPVRCVRSKHEGPHAWQRIAPQDAIERPSHAE